jgi:subtilisin family serine protease
MKKTLHGILLSCSFLLFFSMGTVQAQVKGDPAFGGVAAPQADLQKSPTKLSPDLKKLYDSYAAPKSKIAESTKPSNPAANTTDFSRYMQIRGNSVVIDVTISDDLPSAKAELQKIGVTITAVYGRVISGTIPITALPQLEAASSIRWARPAYKPRHQRRTVNLMQRYAQYIERSAGTVGTAMMAGAPKITPVTSQGDTAQLSYLARKKYKVEGKGVKVGVLSDSYNNLGTASNGVLHGELPGAGNPFNYKKPVQVLEDLDSGGTDEGRAMIEIVHDVAPGAELAFHTADNGQADFAQGIVQLANNGCDVIADDVFYYAEPFFQDGIIAQAVDQVKGQGVAYFSAAGNESIRSYESVYRPTTVEPLGPGNGMAHNFSGPGDAPRYFQPIYIPPGGSIISSFQWDQSSFSASGVGCASDFDIYLLNSAGQVVAGAASDNLKSGDPIEVFGYFNATNNPTFYLVIVKFAGPDPSRLKYILYNDALFYLTTPAIPGILAPTVVGHAKAQGAIATGAAFYFQTPPYGVDTPVVEGFSSVGGVANYYDISGNRIAPQVLNKPEIVAPDGGNTSFFDPFGNGDIAEDTDNFPNFFGTSAAAPHAAGVAALMIEAQKLKTITPSQIKGILETHTWDMDNPYTTGFDKGFDYATGYGLIKADEAVGEVKFPNSYIKNLSLKPLCSANPGTTRNWEIVNPNPFDVPVTWVVVGSSQHASIVAPPGTTDFSTDALYFHNTPLPVIALISWDDNFGFPRLDLAYSSKAVCGKDMVSASNSDQLVSGSATSLSNGKPVIAEVYPNPSAGIFRLYLSLPGQQDVTLQLYSADGKQVQVQRVAQSSGVIDINASGYRPGIYFLKVTQGGTVKTIKLIKN